MKSQRNTNHNIEHVDEFASENHSYLSYFCIRMCVCVCVFTGCILCFGNTFSAYIIDVCNRPALGPKSLQASALPEVAIGTAVHINLTGVTGLR